MEEAQDVLAEPAIELPDAPSIVRSSPLLTRKIMEDFVAMRLRGNEAPKHMDAMCAARDFYEAQIKRNFVHRSVVEDELKYMSSIINRLWSHIERTEKDHSQVSHLNEKVIAPLKKRNTLGPTYVKGARS